MTDKQRIQYEIGFRIPMGPNAIESILDYLPRREYDPSFSHSEDRLSGTLSLDRQLKKEDYDILVNFPHTLSIKLLDLEPIDNP